MSRPPVGESEYKASLYLIRFQLKLNYRMPCLECLQRPVHYSPFFALLGEKRRRYRWPFHALWGPNERSVARYNAFSATPWRFTLYDPVGLIRRVWLNLISAKSFHGAKTRGGDPSLSVCVCV